MDVEDRASAVRAWASAESARLAVRELKRILGDGYELLVFKGAHLAFCVAPRPWLRAMDDADVLLTRGSVFAALRRIEQSGEWRIFRSENGWPLQHRDGYRVDLHGVAVAPRFGRVNIQELRLRSTSAPSDVFGPGVRVPGAVDAAALAIGHFVKDAFRHGDLARDLVLLTQHATIEPRALALRLREFGLRRAAVLALCETVGKETSLEPYRDALGVAHWEQLLARAMARLLRRTRSPNVNWVLVRLATDRPTDAIMGAAERLFAAASRRLGKPRDYTPSDGRQVDPIHAR